MAELDWKVIGTGIFRGNMLLADTADSELSRIGKVAVSTQIVYEHNSHAELLKACLAIAGAKREDCRYTREDMAGAIVVARAAIAAATKGE